MVAGINGLARRLVRDGLLTEALAQRALQRSRSEETTFIAHLIKHSALLPLDLAEAISRDFGLPLLDLGAVEPDSAVLDNIDRNLLLRHLALPLSRRDMRLVLAVADPGNAAAIREIEFHTGTTADLVVTTPQWLNLALDRLSAAGASSDNYLSELEDLPVEAVSLEPDAVPDLEREKESANEAPIIRAVNRIVTDAVHSGASDIHIEPYENQFRIRLRIDGVLRVVASPPIHSASRIISRVKIMSHMNIAERRLPQDGRFRIRLDDGRPIDFRVSSSPTLWGEKLVLRILDKSACHLDIESLGLAPEQERLFRKALGRPQGMVLVTGPTGSGKTVTLYSGLAALNTEQRNIATAEDPVEFNLPGINQLQINHRVGLEFSAALRTFLRQDPDVIMVGEIRDGPTAEIAVKAAQTGHLVLSTLHTNSAAEAISRLQHMGVAAYNLCASLELIIAQRLARRLCDHCKKPASVPPELRDDKRLAQLLDGNPSIFRANGCKRCNSGYRGRVGIYEVVPITAPITRIIIGRGSSLEIAEEARRAGFMSLAQAAIEKVRLGLTSLEEALRLT